MLFRIIDSLADFTTGVFLHNSVSSLNSGDTDHLNSIRVHLDEASNSPFHETRGRAVGLIMIISSTAKIGFGTSIASK